MPHEYRPWKAPAMPRNTSTLDETLSLVISSAARVAPIEWPITSIWPVQELGIALVIALRTGVSSVPLWSLQAAHSELPQEGAKICELGYPFCKSRSTVFWKSTGLPVLPCTSTSLATEVA